MIKSLTPIIAILVIGALTWYALGQGIDGLVLAGSVAIVAGIAGYTAPHKKAKQ